MQLRLVIVLLFLLLVAGLASLGTAAYFSDSEENAASTFQAWTYMEWVQTTQADFNAGVLSNVDTSSSPGDVKLVDAGWGNYSSELLLNPGAETGNITGWTPVGSNTESFTAGFDSPKGSAAPHSGSYCFFWNNPSASDDWAYQEVDLSAYLTEIQAGDAQIRAGGWLICSEYHIPVWDIVRLKVVLYDSTHTEIGTIYDTGELNIPDWTEYLVQDYGLPTNTKYVRLYFQTYEPYWDSGNADDLTVKIRVREHYLSGTLASKVFDTEAAGSTWDELNWSETLGSWHYTSWSKRAPVTISNSGSGLTDHQVRVDIAYDADMQPDFDDIRFTDSDDSTELSHWRETYIDSTSATLWVKVPSIPSGNKTIYMYYGNAAADSASDGTSTFDFFDDFSGDLSKWTIDPENTDKVYIDSVQGNSAPALRHDPDSSQTKNGYFDTRLITSSYTMVNGVIEYDVFLAGTPRIIHQLGFRVNSLSFTNGYCWRMQNATADGGWLRFNNGSWSKIGTNWGPTTGDVWHSVKMDVSDTNFTAYIDGGSAVSVVDANKQTEDYLVSHVHGVSLTASSYVLVDNIRVRKYASAEPTTSVGSEETGAELDITFEVRASDTPFAKEAASPSWNAVGGTSPVTTGLPSGRYIQWRATLTRPDASQTPTLHEVRVCYW